MTDDELIEWIFKGIVTASATIGGVALSMLIRGIDKNKKDLDDHKGEIIKDINKIKSDISEHKLHVSDKYAKLELFDRVYDRLDEMGNDIKILLQRK